MVASLVKLVRVPSMTGTDAGSELQQRQAASLADLGFDVDERDLDPASCYPSRFDNELGAD